MTIDPRQRRFFKSNDLYDLFTFDERNNQDTETGDLFGNTEGVHISLQESRGIEGVEKSEAVEDESENGSKGEGTKAMDDDNRILQELFHSTGVHSALQHDAIMDAVTPESRLIQKEAQMVAKQAVHALKQSRRQIRQQPVEMPTWTGKSGSAGKPKSRSLLDGLRMKSGLLTKSEDTKSPSSSLKDFASKLRDFLAFSYITPSSSIISHFELDSQSKQDMDKLRGMLKEFAIFNNDESGKGWILKDEWKD